MTPSDILYEIGRFFVVKAKHGYEVYESGITHATRKAIIGYEGEKGFFSAKVKANTLNDADID